MNDYLLISFNLIYIIFGCLCYYKLNRLNKKISLLEENLFLVAKNPLQARKVLNSKRKNK